MIPIGTGLTMLRTLTPSLGPVRLPEPVDFTAAEPLAAIVQQQAPIIGQAAALATDVARVQGVLDRAAPEFSAIATDIAHLGTQYLQEAAVYAPKLLSPNPAVAMSARSHLATLPGIYVEAAYARLEEAARRLAPDTAVLQAIAAEGPQERRAVLPASSSSGEGEATPEERERGRRALAAARSQLGTPYVWGGTQPGGFDCSGFTSWSWRQAGVELPRLAEHQSVGKQISQDQLIEGDLLVWDGHVAMYAGNGQIIEAGDPVQISPLRTSNMGMPFQGYYRPQG